VWFAPNPKNAVSPKRGTPQNANPPDACKLTAQAREFDPRVASRWRASLIRRFNSEARFGQSANEGAGRPAPAALAQLK